MRFQVFFIVTEVSLGSATLTSVAGLVAGTALTRLSALGVLLQAVEGANSEDGLGPSWIPVLNLPLAVVGLEEVSSPNRSYLSTKPEFILV